MTIMLMILALLVGLVIGFFGARKYMENYLRNNPPISEEMLRTMMLQMGQNHQVVNYINDASDESTS